MAGRPTALVTGASGGIGAELARLFARDGYDVVLVARSGAPMEELAGDLEERHGVTCTVIPKDLGHPGAAQQVAENLAQRHLGVDALANSAGYGLLGPFWKLDAADQTAMQHVNVVALTDLTRALLPGMIERRRGRILNVASTAGFLPGPEMAVYYATKAYVVSFSLALAEEVAGSGVAITCVAPGTVPSGSRSRADQQGTRVIGRRPMPSAADVAAFAYDAMRAGRPLAIPGLSNRAILWGARILPRRTLARIARRAHERPDR
jgi:short-subunit dehydrogenase